MDTGDMKALLQGYLNELAWAGSLSKETIMHHISERDDDLRTMIEEYIPEGTYEDAFHVMTLIPDQAWQDSQGDQWRGAETQYPKDVETGFADSPLAKKEQQDGIIGRGSATRGEHQEHGESGNSGSTGHRSAGSFGSEGSNAGEVDPAISGSGETTGDKPSRAKGQSS